MYCFSFRAMILLKSTLDFVVGARNISKIKDVVDVKGAVEVSIENDESTYEFATAKQTNIELV